MKQRNRIKEALDAKGKTQVWLADELGVDPVTINRYIKGSRQPSLETLASIAKKLGVPGKDLISF